MDTALMYRPDTKRHFCYPPCIECEHLPEGTVWKCAGCERIYTVRFHGLFGPQVRYHGYWGTASRRERSKLAAS